MVSDKVGATNQRRTAHERLTVIAAAAMAGTAGPKLTYQSLASALGRDPKRHSRAMAQVCDLLDAAAALSHRPSLALWTVRAGQTKRELNSVSVKSGEDHNGSSVADIDRSDVQS